MKAISLHQPWASLIAEGDKTIETRRWSTEYRGELLIVSTKRPVVTSLPAGMALAVVNVADCRPMTEADCQAACCEIYPGAFAWMLTNIRKIKPFAVRGSQGFYEVDYEIKDEDVLKVTRVCRVCGCTEERACWGGCFWVEADMCNACV